MALDKKPFSIATALKIAKQYYDEETYAHAMRVAGYVAENMSIDQEYREDCVALAIMHDLLEDTDFKPYGIPEDFLKALKLLTKNKDEDYVTYCSKLRPTSYLNYQNCAYWVKLADMKDHLSLTETLTEKRKEKYLAGLAALL
jgi:(p)ppGpp synthase/HD superfamily hydrolase